MLDPFSIAVGIFATLQAANASAKIADSLFDIALRAGAIAEEIEFFALHVQSYTSMIATVHSSVRELHQNNKKSRTLKTLKQHKTLQNLALQSEKLMDRVEEVQPQVKPEQDGVGIKGRIRWVIKSSARENLCIWMERLKMCYQFVMLQVIFGTLQERASRPTAGVEGLYDIEKELRVHRRLMKSHMRSMQVFNDQYRPTVQEEFDHSEGEANVDLQAIGRELIRTGKRMVAEHRSSSTSFTTWSTAARHSTSTAHTRAESINERHEDDSGSVISSTPNLHLQIPTSPLPLIQPLRLVRRPSTGASPPAPNPIAQSLPPERPSPETPGSIQHTTIEAPSIPPNSTYIGVYPSTRVIHLDSSLSTQGLAGYIRPIEKGEAKNITALLNQSCPENFISQSLVTQLGLPFVPHEDPDDIKQVDEGRDRKEPTKGVATFRWSDGKVKHQEFLVNCYVCDHTPHRLIFGQRFLRRREHYWGEPSSQAMDDDSLSTRNTIENGEGSASR